MPTIGSYFRRAPNVVGHAAAVGAAAAGVAGIVGAAPIVVPVGAALGTLAAAGFAMQAILSYARSEKVPPIIMEMLREIMLTLSVLDKRKLRDMYFRTEYDDAIMHLNRYIAELRIIVVSKSKEPWKYRIQNMRDLVAAISLLFNEISMMLLPSSKSKTRTPLSSWASSVHFPQYVTKVHSSPHSGPRRTGARRSDRLRKWYDPTDGYYGSGPKTGPKSGLKRHPTH